MEIFKKNDEKETNKNYELSEKDFNEINKDISKALIEMEMKKIPKMKIQIKKMMKIMMRKKKI